MRTENKIETVTSYPELNEDLASQITGWKIQKICWFVMLGLLLLIALGLFGNGPVSRVHIADGNTIVEYERFSRHDTEMDVVLQLNKTNGDADVRIPVDYLAHFKLDKVFPDTYKSRITNESILFSFDTGSKNSITIHFYLYPRKRGRIQGEWMVGPSVFRLSHFIYP